MPRGSNQNMTPEKLAALQAGANRHRAKRTLEVRFWEKVKKAEGDACWLWVGSRRHQQYPYGCIWARGKAQWAHRIAWELEHGPIPEGMQVDHICKNPQCVRHDHLRIVTPRQNWVDYSDSPMAANAKKSHCPQGHPYSTENIALVKRSAMRSGNGKRVGRTTARVCLTCFPSYWRHAAIPRDPPPGARLKAHEKAKYAKQPHHEETPK